MLMLANVNFTNSRLKNQVAYCYLLWLIWATYNSFPKTSENKTHVLHLILYPVCRYFKKWKTRGRMKFDTATCYPTRL